MSSAPDAAFGLGVRRDRRRPSVRRAPVPASCVCVIELANKPTSSLCSSTIGRLHVQRLRDLACRICHDAAPARCAYAANLREPRALSEGPFAAQIQETQRERGLTIARLGSSLSYLLAVPRPSMEHEVFNWESVRIGTGTVSRIPLVDTCGEWIALVLPDTGCRTPASFPAAR